ncbi:MAG: acyl-CoA dehydrogenase family protein [Gammaproteobacteria bacterium]
MDFDLTQDQMLLQTAVERLLGDEYGFEQRKRHMAEDGGWSRAMWAHYAEMGLLGLPFAEADGGLGGGPVETMIVMEAFGRHLVLEPYFATVILAGGCLRIGASAEQRSAMVPKIADGSRLLAFAHVEAGARFDLADVATRARRDGGDWVLDGAKQYVLHGDCADQLIVSARVSGGQRDRDGLALFLVDAGAPGVSRRGYRTQDRLRAADVTFSGVRVPAAALIGAAGAALPVIERVVDIAIAALTAEQVGAMARVHEITVDYLKVRKQFGVLIGSFQALQHRAVDMLVCVEQARSMAMFATMMSTEADALERSRAMSAAKAQIGRAAKFVGEQAIQLHGGIGMTDECSAGHYYRRLTVAEFLFGDSAHHLAALARAGGLP